MPNWQYWSHRPPLKIPITITTSNTGFAALFSTVCPKCGEERPWESSPQPRSLQEGTMSKKLFTAIFALAAMPGLALAQDIPSNTLPAFPIYARQTPPAPPPLAAGTEAGPRPVNVLDALPTQDPGASCSRADWACALPVVSGLAPTFCCGGSKTARFPPWSRQACRAHGFARRARATQHDRAVRRLGRG